MLFEKIQHSIYSLFSIQRGHIVDQSPSLHCVACTAGTKFVEFAFSEGVLQSKFVY